MDYELISNDELDEIASLVDAATPGPWYVRLLDDEAAMNIVAISTVPGDGPTERYPDFDHAEIIAATLVQQPRYVDVADGKWDENANFIASARNFVPRLISEIKRLRDISDGTE